MSFKKVRDAHKTENTEDYLEIIADLLNTSGEARIVDIANKLGFTQNSPGLDAGPENIIRWTGTWGDLSTQSFYPPHHLTMGEGGSVNIVKSKKLAVIAESFRDWGRDCWCPSGIDNTCKKRFDWHVNKTVSAI